MPDSMLGNLNAHRSGVGDPDMVGQELAKVRAELRDYYATWEASAPAYGTGRPRGPEYEWLALRAVGALLPLLDTVDFLRDTLDRIEHDREPTRAERDASQWWGTSDYEPAEAIASMARRLTGED